MIPLITVPVPMETPEVQELFQEPLRRFADTMMAFPPGVENSLLIPILNVGNDWGASQRRTFYDPKLFSTLKTIPFTYFGAGADAGSFQFVAKSFALEGLFQICFTSRVYFHRAGWLQRYMAAREQYGPALYGIAASREGGHEHVRGCGMAFDTADFAKYPHKLDSRDKGVFNELGEGCITDWFESIGRKAYVVTWDGVYERKDWLNIENGFRRGNQEQLLVFDKHSDAWANADASEKERLTKLMEGK